MSFKKSWNLMSLFENPLNIQEQHAFKVITFFKKFSEQSQKYLSSFSEQSFFISTKFSSLSSRNLDLTSIKVSDVFQNVRTWSFLKFKKIFSKQCFTVFLKLSKFSEPMFLQQFHYFFLHT